jgi:hypothetical protein
VSREPACERSKKLLRFQGHRIGPLTCLAHGRVGSQQAEGLRVQVIVTKVGVEQVLESIVGRIV